MPDQLHTCRLELHQPMVFRPADNANAGEIKNSWQSLQWLESETTLFWCLPDGKKDDVNIQKLGNFLRGLVDDGADNRHLREHSSPLQREWPQTVKIRSSPQFSRP